LLTSTPPTPVAPICAGVGSWSSTRREAIRPRRSRMLVNRSSVPASRLMTSRELPQHRAGAHWCRSPPTAASAHLWGSPAHVNSPRWTMPRAASSASPATPSPTPGPSGPPTRPRRCARRHSSAMPYRRSPALQPITTMPRTRSGSAQVRRANAGSDTCRGSDGIRRTGFHRDLNHVNRRGGAGHYAGH
jgi:hypothetical protein